MTYTEITINTEEYNQVYLDDVSIEFVPTYRNGNNTGMLCRVNVFGKEAFSAHIDKDKTFCVCGKVTGKTQRVSVKIKGTLDYTQKTYNRVTSTFRVGTEIKERIR